jgi:hypothetical protein
MTHTIDHHFVETHLELVMAASCFSGQEQQSGNVDRFEQHLSFR